MARRVLLVLALATAAIGALSAQAQRNPATLDDLVNEVRGLRAEVSQAAGASMRMQLLVARLQLQEQRIITVAGQLTEVRRLLSNNEAGQIRPGTQIKEFEEALRNPALPEHMQRDIPGMLSRLKVELGQAQKEEQQLRLQETELQSALSAEQNRWMDFNARLDELERSLPSR